MADACVCTRWQLTTRTMAGSIVSISPPWGPPLLVLEPPSAASSGLHNVPRILGVGLLLLDDAAPGVLEAGALCHP